MDVTSVRKDFNVELDVVGPVSQYSYCPPDQYSSDVSPVELLLSQIFVAGERQQKLQI